MTRILLIARNAFRAVMSKRALYIWSAAILLMFIRAAPALFIESQDESLRRFLQANAVAGAMETWAMLCIGAAVLLGAGAVSTEITTKTIVTLLARPVRRWELCVGKWLGVTAFVAVSLAIGVALDMAIANYLGIDVERKVLIAALAHTMVAAILFSGVTVIVGTSGSAAVAVAITVLLMFLPGLINVLETDPRPRPKAIGKALGYLVPPGHDSLYQGITWAPFPQRNVARGTVQGQQAAPPPTRVRPRMEVDYPAVRKQLYKNLAYAAVYFLIGCAIFTRKDVKLA